MARNRKRAKDRRPRRPAPPGSTRRGIPTATHEPDLEPERNGVLDPAEENGVPDPLDHATPDVELADAQLAFGRPAESEPEDEAEDEEELELEAEESIRTGAGGGRRGGGSDDLDGAVVEAGGHGPARGERREAMPARLIGFLEGCWRELQRVQWPDRRQVMQATGVVIGFVIIAAAFLGLSDFVSGKLVTFILK